MIGRVRKLFGDIEPDETLNVLLLAFNLFIAMAGYYVIKTVREPLILESGGAALKTYSAAFQAVVIAVLFIPFYGWVSKKVSRITLNYVLIGMFFVSTELFWVLAQFKVPYLGFAFFVWVGLFSLSIVSQFWSYSSDLFSKSAGERLFPVIAIGATLGSPVGSFVAARLFDLGLDAYTMLHVTAAMLLVHGGLYYVIHKRIGERKEARDAGLVEKEETKSANGFAMVFQNKYLGLIALMLLILNLVNTTGEYILSSYVVEAAVATIGNGEEFKAARGQYIGAFYGDFFFVVNIVTFLIQTFVVARLVKYLGLRGVIFILPVVAIGTYGLVLFGASFAIFRIGKTMENSTDYSIMNTVKAMLWLPTTKEEKYAAKQTIDTFFVRLGDVLSAAFVFLGNEIFDFSKGVFASANLVFILVWIYIAWRVYHGYKSLSDADADTETEVAG